MKEAIKNGVDGYYFDRATSRRGSESNQHYHTGFEIYYMKEGRCRYFIDDRSYDVISGDVVVIPMGVIHRTNYGSQPHSRLLINFTEDFFHFGYIVIFAAETKHKHAACIRMLYKSAENKLSCCHISAKLTAAVGM